MVRFMLISVALAVVAAGCTPAYRVHVNTYAEPDLTLSQAASIYVLTDPNSANPILRRQIVSKMTQLLEGYGYNPVDKVEAADYILTFTAGIDSERVVDYMPLHMPYYGFYGRRFGGWRFGYTTYVPYADTVYTHWLRMRLYVAEADAGGDEGLVWLGEAVTGTGSPELREAVDYLLVGCIEHFGQDTREWVTMKIAEDDPRILGIVMGGSVE